MMKELVDGVLSFVRSLLDDASLWFWFAVAIGALLFADARGVIPLARATVELRVGLAALLVVVTCLCLNALGTHQVLTRAASSAYQRSAAKYQRWQTERRRMRVAPGSKDELRNLLTLRCAERRWLVWFALEGETLPYGTAQYGEEFAAVRSLLKRGLLHRTGDDAVSIVFLHKQLYKVFMDAHANDESLRCEIETEHRAIVANERQALQEKLPTYATAEFFRDRRTA